MRLVTFRKEGGVRVGALYGDLVLDVSLSASAVVASDQHRRPLTLLDVLEAPEGLQELESALKLAVDDIATGEPTGRAVAYSRDEVTLLAPVLRPTKVIGAGMNYRSFVEALGEDMPKHPVLFHKTSSALTGCGGDIVLPHVTEQAVPEGELAIIIGKRARFVEPERAMEHIAGFTCANDISAKDLEFRTSQWTSGKMLATFCPLGPALVTPNEVYDPLDLEIRTILNGATIQCGRTSDMIFDIPHLVSEISSVVTLEPGDVILTGTPSDLGEVDPPVFLRAGDTIGVHIEGVGVLENPVIQEVR